MVEAVEGRVLALLAAAHPFDPDSRRPPGNWESTALHPTGQAVLIIGLPTWRPAALVRWGLEGDQGLPSLVDLLRDLDGAWTSQWYGDLPKPEWFQEVSGAEVWDDSNHTKHRYAASPVVSNPIHPILLVTRLSDLADLRGASLWQLWCEGLGDQPDDEQDLPDFDAWRQQWDRALAAGGVLVTAWDGDEAVAVSGLVRTAEIAYVQATAVRRSFRGRGFSRSVKQGISAWACTAGVRTVLTDVRDSNPAMLATNASLGYRRIPLWMAERF